MDLQALDQPFNPEHHEAMFAMEMPGKVGRVFGSGDTVGNRVI